MNSLQGFAVHCWLLPDGCWLMAAGCWAVHESELNEGCKNSPLDPWGWSGGISGGSRRVPGGTSEVLEGSLGFAWESQGGPRASLEVSLGTLGGAWGPWGRPWRVLGGSLGVPRGPWVVPGVLAAPQGGPGAPHGRPQGGLMSRFDGKTQAVLTIPGNP